MTEHLKEDIMGNCLKECKGCLESKDDQCLVPDELMPHCICRNCVVKVMCKNCCKEFDDMIENYIEQCDKERWKYIKKENNYA